MNNKKQNFKPEIKKNASSVILMPLLYNVVPNQLDKENNTFCPRMQSSYKLYYDDIVKILFDSYGIREQEIDNVIKPLMEVVISQLQEGKSIHFDWFRTYLTARGTLANPDESFSPRTNPEHTVYANLTFTSNIQKRIQDGLKNIKRTEKSANGITVSSIHDYFVKVDNKIRVGGTAIVKGFNFQKKKDIKLEISLENAEGNRSVIEDVNVVSDKTLEFIVDSSLEKGEYRLYLEEVNGAIRGEEHRYSEVVTVE